MQFNCSDLNRLAQREAAGGANPSAYSRAQRGAGQGGDSRVLLRAGPGAELPLEDDQQQQKIKSRNNQTKAPSTVRTLPAPWRSNGAEGTERGEEGTDCGESLGLFSCILAKKKTNKPTNPPFSLFWNREVVCGCAEPSVSFLFLVFNPILPFSFGPIFLLPPPSTLPSPTKFSVLQKGKRNKKIYKNLKNNNIYIHIY